jgi:hypothetical protein
VNSEGHLIFYFYPYTEAAERYPMDKPIKISIQLITLPPLAYSTVFLFHYLAILLTGMLVVTTSASINRGQRGLEVNTTVHIKWRNTEDCHGNSYYGLCIESLYIYNEDKKVKLSL